MTLWPSLDLKSDLWERDKVSHKRVFAVLTPEKPQLQISKTLQKLSVATPAEPRGAKKLFVGKFWAVKNF